MEKRWKRGIALVLAGLMAVLWLGGCGSGGAGNVAEERQYTYWITTDDSNGTYYKSYEENPVVQWLTQQYWNADSHSIGDEENGEQLYLEFSKPVPGAEEDNFSTMLSTQEYTDIMDLSYYKGSPKTLCEDGVLMEITEYVEKYMPDYVEELERHPELEAFVRETDENGDKHYYALYAFGEAADPWEGFLYRRDWLVEYATPSEYVWDWDSEEVKNNGHPAVTPLSAAVAAGNLIGWKKNEVTEFSSSEDSSDPTETYQDNVIFPSGTDEPLTISDWEWMMEAFSKAIEDKGFDGNDNAYCISSYYLGYIQTGDLVSSFGGGGPMWYIDGDGNAAFGATDDNFKAYVECMNNWYEMGWLDKIFETRSSDMFFEINTTGYSQGMVGMWLGAEAYWGNTIRKTCVDETDRQKAMVFPCALPINDVYGSDAQKFVNPDMYYTASGLSNATGFTNTLEEKDTATLFTMLNWMYTEEGARMMSMGLSNEQYEEVTLDPDVYADNGMEGAYTIQYNDDGSEEFIWNADDDDASLSHAMIGFRINTYGYSGPSELKLVDKGMGEFYDNAMEMWTRYPATAYIRDYNGLLDEEQAATYNKINSYINDAMGIEVPKLIKEGLDGWDSYCKKNKKYGADQVTEIYQSILDENRTS